MSPKRAPKRSRQLGAESVVGHRLIEVRYGEGAVRDLRASLLQLSYQLAARGPEFRGYLVLDHPGITAERLRTEWELAHSVLRPEVLSRLTLCVTDATRSYNHPHAPDAETQAAIDQVRYAAPQRQARHHDRGSSWFVVTKLLMSSWLRADGPITTDQLIRSTGYSYPTVASVLRDLKSYVTRTSDRRVELRSLPRDLVERWLRESERARRTVRFADRSRTPRTPESLASRLAKLQIEGLALGGVLGAMHYYPDLDLTGAPRLDISQRTDAQLGLEFISQLDPALEQVDDPREPAVLVVHGVTEADPMFEAGEQGLDWASPMECLLDLSEAKLMVQAGQFLEALLHQRKTGV
ncbi:MAG: hypothetical protein ABL977_11305 [Candidatus Eisenbacteria bacterium]